MGEPTDTAVEPAASATSSDAPALDVKALGNPNCGTGALTAAYAAIGLKPDGTPIDGKAARYDAVASALPQLVDYSGAGLGGWNAQLDQPNGGVKDDKISNLEVAAAVIAASQVATSRNIPVKDVPIQEIVDGMCEPLKELRGQSQPVCRPGDSPATGQGR